MDCVRFWQEIVFFSQRHLWSSSWTIGWVKHSDNSQASQGLPEDLILILFTSAYQGVHVIKFVALVANSLTQYGLSIV